MKKDGFKECCAERIKQIWGKFGPTNIVHYETHCYKCGHYIGLTQTSEKEADIFLKKFGLSKRLLQ